MSRATFRRSLFTRSFSTSVRSSSLEDALSFPTEIPRQPWQLKIDLDVSHWTPSEWVRHLDFAKALKRS